MENFSGFSKNLFQLFDLCIPSSTISKNNLIELGAKTLIMLVILNLLLIENILLDKKNIIILNKYLVWCAASLHGEIFV